MRDALKRETPFMLLVVKKGYFLQGALFTDKECITGKCAKKDVGYRYSKGGRGFQGSLKSYQREQRGH